MQWLKNLKGKVRHNEPLSKHTSFKIGGPCRVWFEPHDVDDLIVCLRLAKKENMPYCIIGAGTNILMRNGGFRGIVIKLKSPSFKRLAFVSNTLRAGAGARIQDMVRYLSSRKVSGYEFLAGIPGTIGGALVMNAGTTFEGRQCAIGDSVQTVRVLDRRWRVRTLTRSGMRFRYRNSNLGNYIILGAQFRFKSGKSAAAKRRIEDFLLSRAKKQDYSKPNAGCIFKNPSPRVAAGRLLEQSGCKGMRCGGAKVSDKHANFILNFNSATAADVIKLIGRVKTRVKKKFGITLHEEIHIV